VASGRRRAKASSTSSTPGHHGIGPALLQPELLPLEGVSDEVQSFEACPLG
jgi:hypothetical protein